MKTKLFLLVFTFLFTFQFFTVPAIAHPGDTDENGGHYDQDTGEYHYHHGYPAHQHRGGKCPYENSLRDPYPSTQGGSTSKGFSSNGIEGLGFLFFIVLFVFAVIVFGILLHRRLGTNTPPSLDYNDAKYYVGQASEKWGISNRTLIKKAVADCAQLVRPPCPEEDRLSYIYYTDEGAAKRLFAEAILLYHKQCAHERILESIERYNIIQPTYEHIRKRYIDYLCQALTQSNTAPKNPSHLPDVITGYALPISSPKDASQSFHIQLPIAQILDNVYSSCRSSKSKTFSKGRRILDMCIYIAYDLCRIYKQSHSPEATTLFEATFDEQLLCLALHRFKLSYEDAELFLSLRHTRYKALLALPNEETGARLFETAVLYMQLNPADGITDIEDSMYPHFSSTVKEAVFFRYLSIMEQIKPLYSDIVSRIEE